MCLEHAAGAAVAAGSDDEFAATYRALVSVIPTEEVQVVSATNTAYLLPWAYRSARFHLGRLDAWRLAMRATKPGTAIIDGLPVGEVVELGVGGILSRLQTYERR